LRYTVAFEIKHEILGFFDLTKMAVNVQTLFDDYHFAWYGQRALDCVGLNRYLDIDLILCCDYGLETALQCQILKSRLFSVEENTFKRENWTSSSLGDIFESSGPQIEHFLKELPEPIHLIAYSATESLSRFARLHGVQLKTLMPDYQLKAWLDDKRAFARAVKDLGLSVVPSFIGQMEDVHFDEARRSLGLPFVIQRPFGSSGIGTFFVNSEVELEQVRLSLGQSSVLVSKFINGISLNINAAVVGDQTLVDWPSVQLVGLPDCSTRREVYCGNDYSATKLLPAPMISSTQQCARQVGSWLHALGYQGLFGLDLIAEADTSKVYAIDLNARFQNSTHLLTQSHILSGRVPLPVLTVAWQLGLIDSDYLVNWQSEVFQEEGAQVIIHNLADRVTIVQGDLLPGIYQISQAEISRMREGLSLLDTVAADEFVVTCAVPRLGTIVMPGAPLFKLMTRQSVYDLERRQLNPAISDACNVLYGRLRLQ
jgi:hypothetical protein